MRPQLTTMERTFQMVAMATAADRKRARDGERERGRGTVAVRSVGLCLPGLCFFPPPVGPGETLLAVLPARDPQSPPRQKPGASLERDRCWQIGQSPASAAEERRRRA